MRSQALTALERANRLRMDRAAEKRRIFRMARLKGNAEVAEILLCPGDLWEGAKLGYVLELPRSVGPVAVTKKCRRLGVDPDTRLRDIPPRLRMAAAVLTDPDTVADLVVAA